MRTALTRAVEEIENQYRFVDGLILPDEKERSIRINFPAIKKIISIPQYTAKSRIKAIIREAMRGEKEFQEMMIR